MCSLWISEQRVIFIYTVLIGICNRYAACLLWGTKWIFNPLNAELNPICLLLTLLGIHPILHVSRIRVNFIILAFFFLQSVRLSVRMEQLESPYTDFNLISFMRIFRKIFRKKCKYDYNLTRNKDCIIWRLVYIYGIWMDSS